MGMILPKKHKFTGFCSILRARFYKQRTLTMEFFDTKSCFDNFGITCNACDNFKYCNEQVNKGK